MISESGILKEAKSIVIIHKDGSKENITTKTGMLPIIEKISDCRLKNGKVDIKFKKKEILRLCNLTHPFYININLSYFAVRIRSVVDKLFKDVNVIYKNKDGYIRVFD